MGGSRKIQILVWSENDQKMNSNGLNWSEIDRDGIKLSGIVWISLKRCKMVQYSPRLYEMIWNGPKSCLIVQDCLKWFQMVWNWWSNTIHDVFKWSKMGQDGLLWFKMGWNIKVCFNHWKQYAKAWRREGRQQKKKIPDHPPHFYGLIFSFCSNLHASPAVET